MELRVRPSDFVLEQHSRLRTTYKMGRKLGEGAYSSVHLLTHRDTGEFRAVKITNKKHHRPETFLNEVELLRELDHPNIARLYEYYQDDSNYYTITEYCNGGDLFQQIVKDTQFREATASEYLHQILNAVCYLHARGIVYRDIKLDNFLLEHSFQFTQVKITGFGAACNGPTYGAPLPVTYYTAPESLQGIYTTMSDMWNIGALLYTMICGYPPFGGHSSRELAVNITIGRLYMSDGQWKAVSPAVKGLIEVLLQQDPSERISAQKALQHPWVSSTSKVAPHSLLTAQMQNLKSFHAECLVQKAVTLFIGAQLTTKDEREELTALFRSLDLDNDGALSREELKQGFLCVFGDLDEEELECIIKELDCDHSGLIEYTEFVMAAVNKRQLLNRERLAVAFKAFDIDRNGGISAAELQYVLGQRPHCDESLWRRLIVEADLNGDGELDFQEFLALMTGSVGDK